MGIFMLFTNILPEAICCCLQTCNVYGVWVTLYYKVSWSLVLTSASYRYTHLACLVMYCLRLFVVVYKLVMLMLCCY